MESPVNGKITDNQGAGIFYNEKCELMAKEDKAYFDMLDDVDARQ
jgi:hypothetical protein